MSFPACVSLSVDACIYMCVMPDGSNGSSCWTCRKRAKGDACRNKDDNDNNTMSNNYNNKSDIKNYHNDNNDNNINDDYHHTNIQNEKNQDMKEQRQH